MPTHRPPLPNAARYTGVAIALHWCLGATVLLLVAVGVYMVDLPFSPLRLKLFNWHKWAGVAFLVLSVWRLLWRLSHRPPALPPAIAVAMPRWQARLYQALHPLFYALFLLVPVLGWAYSSAAGFPMVWLGQIALPDLLPVNQEWAALIKPLHKLSALALLGLAALHAGAALKHHWIDHDGLLRRMWPSRP